MASPLAIAATVQSMPSEELGRDPEPIKRMLLEAAETVMETWIEAHTGVPTQNTYEGFRLLALHRQIAREDPSFNACRESCRELVYQCNVAETESVLESKAQRLRMAATVLAHLALFIDGKLENARLGEFCCSARPIRARDAATDVTYAINHQQGDAS